MKGIDAKAKKPQAVYWTSNESAFLTLGPLWIMRNFLRKNEVRMHVAFLGGAAYPNEHRRHPHARACNNQRC